MKDREWFKMGKQIQNGERLPSWKYISRTGIGPISAICAPICTKFGLLINRPIHTMVAIAQNYTFAKIQDRGGRCLELGFFPISVATEYRISRGFY